MEQNRNCPMLYTTSLWKIMQHSRCKEMTFYCIQTAEHIKSPLDPDRTLFQQVRGTSQTPWEKSELRRHFPHAAAAWFVMSTITCLTGTRTIKKMFTKQKRMVS